MNIRSVQSSDYYTLSPLINEWWGGRNMSDKLPKLIKKLIECDGNITLASKKMYMHRNTLQNRLEKFQQMTQKDIRQFSHRLEVYLAIIFLEPL